MRQQAESYIIIEKLTEKEGAVADSKDPFEVPGMEGRRGASKRPEVIDKTKMEKLEKALQPYEKSSVAKRDPGRSSGSGKWIDRRISGTSQAPSNASKRPGWPFCVCGPTIPIERN